MGYLENKNKFCGRSLKIRCGKSKEGDYYEMYDFDSDQWKTLDVISPNWKIWGTFVSLKGNTYWPPSERNSFGYIICFDFTREKFGPLLHLPFVNGYNNTLTIFCVREDKLAVAYKEYCRLEVEIWITTKIETEKLSFSKILRIEVGTRLMIKEGISFFDEKKLAIGIYIESLDSFHIVGEAGSYRQLDLGEPAGGYCNRRNWCYVPSLVQIKQPAGGR